MPYYKKIYIYRNSKLPELGWIQSCFNCYGLTSSVISYRTVKTTNYLYDIEVYLCSHCKKEFQTEKANEMKFIIKCNNYINSNIILI